MLSETVSYTDEPILYLKLAFTATFFAGVFQASLGFLRSEKIYTFCIFYEKLLLNKSNFTLHTMETSFGKSVVEESIHYKHNERPAVVIKENFMLDIAIESS